MEKQKKIILASSSPRRKEVLEKLKIPFEVEVSGFEEDITLPLPPEELAEHLSAGKAEDVSERNPEAVVIAADTLVVFENQVLGKPKSEEEAFKTLKMLSGKENRIITGVTIVEKSAGKKISFHQTVRVFMREISDEEIESYIKTGEPMDKAGSYALQELGAVFIEKIEGDFFSAVGMPLFRLSQELPTFGVKII